MVIVGDACGLVGIGRVWEVGDGMLVSSLALIVVIPISLSLDPILYLRWQTFTYLQNLHVKANTVVCPKPGANIHGHYRVVLDSKLSK